MKVVGVDGCKAGWIAVGMVDGCFDGACFVPRFAVLVEAFPDARIIAVDIPIGLLAKGCRAADLAAKKFLQRSSPCVFVTPPRPVLEAPTYAEARRVAHRLGGPGVSAQAYGLRQKILEVDPIAARDARIIEVHPEASFRALAGGELEASKKTPAGQLERRRLLHGVGIRLPAELAEAARPGAADDLLDAAAAAWSGWRAACRAATPLPDPPERGPDLRAIAIWV